MQFAACCGFLVPVVRLFGLVRLEEVAQFPGGARVARGGGFFVPLARCGGVFVGVVVVAEGLHCRDDSLCGGFFLPVGAVKALVVQDFAVFALRDGVALFGGGFQVFFGGDVVVARAVKAGELVSVARGVRVGGVAVFASQA